REVQRLITRERCGCVGEGVGNPSSARHRVQAYLRCEEFSECVKDRINKDCEALINKVKNTSGDALFGVPRVCCLGLLLCLGLRLPALPIDEHHRRRNAANKGIDFLRLRVKRKKKIREEFLTCFAQLPTTLE